MSEKKEKQYVSDNAQLMAEWNWEKNTNLNPTELTLGSHKKAWWKCKNGHEWQVSIYHRIDGNGCVYCSNKKVLKGYNDLQTVNPTLANEWNCEKNNGIMPTDVMPNSNKKVWWKCCKGHEWQTTIDHRNKGSGCPYCSGRYAIKGENDLRTVNPILANEWNYEKNGDLKPELFLANSGKKVWWKCKKGHEWQAEICNRNYGKGCPVCNSERHTSLPEYVIVYYLKKYGLEAIHSYRELGYELDVYIPSKKIAIEYDGFLWHKNKVNKDLDKNQRCKKDGIILYRIREGLPSLNDSSIDYIVQESQKNLSQVLEKVLSKIIDKTIDVDLKRDAIEIENLREYTEKENSILLSNPEIAKEWNYEKNGNLKPEHLLANSEKNMWWKCQKGHEWQATIVSRNKGSGCPYCAGSKVLRGYNDLQTVSPTLAREWNYDKNGNLKPEQFSANSGKKVWWKCQKGHEWQVAIASRNIGRGCPYCSGRYAIKGENDLQTVNPTLASEWNYDKNGDLKPEHFLENSGKKVWWKCQKGHEWQATINNRKKGSGCPCCAGKKVIKGYNDLQTINPALANEWNYDKNDNLTPMDVMPNSNKKVWWICSKGHEWEAKIQTRNRGSKCPYCSGRKE